MDLTKHIIEVEDHCKQLQAELKAVRAEKRLADQMLSAMQHTVVVTIGGVDYEGFPTSEINYIQRLRILVEKERQFDRRNNELGNKPCRIQ